ncbi:protein S100-A9 [Heterocephalus glaber]|uniref:Protein S100-A9 n=2 Tax=Heterocephalus glaber TaxID=10181 RepID=A0AAX6QA00_HETGA|nr:protein S100-A9 [Heterocephalus glaber]
MPGQHSSVDSAVYLLGSECKKMTSEMSLLERSLDTTIKTFHRYSTQEGNLDTLSKKEFKQLVQRELPNFLKNESRNEAAINDIMEDLDTNLDQQLSFEELTMLLARLINASHEKMHEGNHPRGHGHSHGPGLGESGQRH